MEFWYNEDYDGPSFPSGRFCDRSPAILARRDAWLESWGDAKDRHQDIANALHETLSTDLAAASANPTRLKMHIAKIAKDDLVDILHQILTGGPKGALALIDSKAAKAEPFPLWATENVLLSEDLLPNILRCIGDAYASPKRVCKLWHVHWKKTRRHNFFPRYVMVDAGTAESRCFDICTNTNSEGDKSLVVLDDDTTSILTSAGSDTCPFPTMKTVMTTPGAGEDPFDDPLDPRGLHDTLHIQADGDVFYVASRHKLYRVTTFGESKPSETKPKEVRCARVDTQYNEDSIRQIRFCKEYSCLIVLICEPAAGYDYLQLYDADLRLLSAFRPYEDGIDKGDIYGMHLADNELYLCFTCSDRIKVYEIEPRASGSGMKFCYKRTMSPDREVDWTQPMSLTSARVGETRVYYLVELNHNENRTLDDGEQETLVPNRGKRIVVMNAKGSVLGTYKMKYENDFSHLSGELVYYNGFVYAGSSILGRDGEIQTALHALQVTNRVDPNQ